MILVFLSLGWGPIFIAGFVLQVSPSLAANYGPQAFAMSWIPLLSFRLPKQEVFDATLLDRSQPPGDLFDIVAPGGSVDRIVEVVLWIKALQLKMNKQSGTYWLSVRVQYWPSSEAVVSELEQSWSRFGRLWTRELQAAPVELSIDRDPKIERCTGRID